MHFIAICFLPSYFHIISKFQYNANSECNQGRRHHHLALEHSYHHQKLANYSRMYNKYDIYCKQYIMQFNLFAIKFQCKIDGMKFKTKPELTQHHRTVHSNISS